MRDKEVKQLISRRNICISLALALTALSLCGCAGGLKGYNHQWLQPRDISSVYVEMFDSNSLRRGHEYVLTEAICKRIESETPYKIVSDRNVADSILSGRIIAIRQQILATDRYTGRPLENEMAVQVQVNWKNLDTGELLIDNKNVTASASFSSTMGQNFDYAAKAAVNKAAERVVELMQTEW